MGVVLSPVYTAVTWQWVSMSQYVFVVQQRKRAQFWQIRPANASIFLNNENTQQGKSHLSQTPKAYGSLVATRVPKLFTSINILWPWVQKNARYFCSFCNQI
jgi:hypothetical protein